MDIKVGDLVLISKDLGKKLLELEFDKPDCIQVHNKFAGTIQKAHAIWKDTDGTEYVTVDLCVEIPVACCKSLA